MSHTLSIIENSASNKTFVFEGDFTIQNIESTKNEILKHTKGCDTIILNINKITNFDITFTQMVLAFTIHCENQKISLSIQSSEMDEECKKTMEKSGFNNIIRI